MIKGLLLDLDEVICNSETEAHQLGLDALYNSYKQSYEIELESFKLLYDKARAEIKREHKGLSTSHERLFYIQRMVEITHGTVIPELILRHYHAYWDTLINNLELTPNSLELLKTVKQLDIKTAIITNLTAYIQMRKISKLNITQYIDHLVTSQEAGVEKPHPGIYLLALKKLNLLPSDTIMVGDSLETDIDGGNASGIKTIWFNRNRERDNKYIEIIKPTFTVTNLSKIVEYF